jgi:ketosteroid isomerase-like protein
MITKLLARRVIILAIAAIFLSSGGGVRAGGAREAIEALNRKFEEAHLKGDAKAIAMQYTADAQALWENQGIVQGRDAIEKLWKDDIGNGGRTAKVQTLEVEQHGKWAYEVGKFLVTGPDGKMVYDGKYLIIWKKEHGRWWIYRDMGNTNTKLEK